MRVVITGATGNVGTSLVGALTRDPNVESILGLARRVPALDFPKTTWMAADVTRSNLVEHFRGADVVVHLAWLIQPSRRLEVMRATNVDGSERVFQAAADADVPALVYASSIGAYSPGPKDEPVDESWPTEGVQTSFYARHKSEVERLLDRFEQDAPGVRIVRLRKALVFKREAASGIRRLFFGPLLPSVFVSPKLIPVFPHVPGRLVFQAVHSHDAGEAYRLAITRDVRGPFNVAADPILSGKRIAELLRSRPIPVPARLLRTAADLTWRLRLQPSPVGWVDMGLNVPIMKTTRARTELGWTPKYTAEEAVLDLLEGLRNDDGIDTPPLSPATGGPLRARELLTGIGGKGG